MNKAWWPLGVGVVTLITIFTFSVFHVDSGNETLWGLVVGECHFITAGVVILFTVLAVIHATAFSRWNLLYFAQIALGFLFLILLVLGAMFASAPSFR